MRVAIIGARRVRQGLGPYLARFVVEAGHELVAVVGTTPETSRQAAIELERDLGIRPAAAWSPKTLAEHTLDAIVIASPHATHENWLQFALDRHVHVLCEKPLLWDPTSSQMADSAELWARTFELHLLVLRVNAQWPFTLDTYRRLHPGAPAVPEQFFMQMPPRSEGLAMIVDSLSHPLSMLGRFDADPEARLEDLVFHEGGACATRWRMTFGYRTATRRIACEVVLDATPDETRATSFALDGLPATRTVDPTTYAMTLSDGDRRIPLPDPTPRLVRSFLEHAEREPDIPGIDPAALPGMRHLVEIVETAAQHYGVPRP